MAKTKIKEKSSPSTKKLNRQLIEHRLEEAFADFKEVAGKKKFEQSLRKAGKLINSSLSKKAFEKLRKEKENAPHIDREVMGVSHTSINDLP